MEILAGIVGFYYGNIYFAAIIVEYFDGNIRNLYCWILFYGKSCLLLNVSL